MRSDSLSFMVDREIFSFRLDNTLKKELLKIYGDKHTLSYTVRNIMDLMSDYQIQEYIEDKMIKYDLNISDVIRLTVIKFLRFKGNNIYSDF